MIRLPFIVVLLAVIAFPLTAPTPEPAAAQAGGMVDCAELYQQALVDMMAHCFDAQPGTVCGASGSVTITMESGQVATGAGASARINGVASLALEASEDSGWPLASFTLPDAFDQRKSAAVLVMGPAELSFASDSSLTPGAAFTLATANAPLCRDLPVPGVLVQSPTESLTQLRINDTDVMVNGTALISTRSGGTLNVSALTRETILGQSGTVVFAGYGVSVMGEFAGEIAPYAEHQVANLPVQILPEMPLIALPGNATTNTELSLYTQPGEAYYSNTTIRAGLPVSVFGRDGSGNWLHVRTYQGASGWMPAYGLDVNVPVALPVYDEAPAAPIRPFGSVQGYIKTTYEHNNLREGPGEAFPIVETVPLLTDLALYGRSPDGNWLYVETLDGARAWVNTVVVSNSTPYSLEDLPIPPEVTQ